MPNLEIEGKTIPVMFPKWVTKFGYWKLSLFDGAIDVLVTTYTLGHNNRQDHPNWGKWEVTIGCNYYSRNNERFFYSPQEAIQVAEKLVQKMGTRIVQVCEQSRGNPRD